MKFSRCFAAVGPGQEFSKLPQSQVVRMSITWEPQQYGNEVVAFTTKNRDILLVHRWIIITVYVVGIVSATVVIVVAVGLLVIVDFELVPSWL